MEYCICRDTICFRQYTLVSNRGHSRNGFQGTWQGSVKSRLLCDDPDRKRYSVFRSDRQGFVVLFFGHFPAIRSDVYEYNG